MKIEFKNILLAFIVLSLGSCAQHKTAQKKIDKEITEMVILKDESASETAKDFIQRSDKLTTEQKTKLLQLNESTTKLNQSIKEEIEKAKMLLVQTVLEPKMNSYEYAVLKKRITRLEKKKLENSFKAVTEARNIIEPKKNLGRSEFYKAFLHNHILEY